ncbi:hypothetical protein BGX27_002442 [Mortierella sp. AM989]|nr:hypothetical protein BGX27_002442 [Mortierella sp. AM989]
MTPSPKRNKTIPTSPQAPPSFPPAAVDPPAQFTPLVLESLFLLVSEPSPQDSAANDDDDDGDDDETIFRDVKRKQQDHDHRDEPKPHDLETHKHDLNNARDANNGGDRH